MRASRPRRKRSTITAGWALSVTPSGTSVRWAAGRGGASSSVSLMPRSARYSSRFVFLSMQLILVPRGARAPTDAARNLRRGAPEDAPRRTRAGGYSFCFLGVLFTLPASRAGLTGFTVLVGPAAAALGAAPFTPPATFWTFAVAVRCSI